MWNAPGTHARGPAGESASKITRAGGLAPRRAGATRGRGFMADAVRRAAAPVAAALSALFRRWNFRASTTIIATSHGLDRAG